MRSILRFPSSRSARRNGVPSDSATWLRTVYNGIDLRHFTLRERRGDYLAFLRRISPEKCADRAIAIARAVGMPLRIAAKVDPVDEAYFTEKIQPLLRDPLVELVAGSD